jgi:hypothetical protein
MQVCGAFATSGGFLEFNCARGSGQHWIIVHHASGTGSYNLTLTCSP